MPTTGPGRERRLAVLAQSGLQKHAGFCDWPLTGSTAGSHFRPLLVVPLTRKRSLNVVLSCRRAHADGLACHLSPSVEAAS